MTEQMSPVRVHPLAVVLMPIPAIIAVLIADGVLYGLLCVAVGLVAACVRGLRFAAGVALMIVLATAMLWFGFTLSLPSDPLGRVSPHIEWLPLRPSEDQLLVGLRGALRIMSIMALYVATFAFVKWPVLADTLIKRFQVPYRIVDVSALGGRFAVLIRHDFDTARSLARLRAHGHPLRQLRLLAGLAVPVLMASFRHADQLAIAMEARGFGAREDRTVHDVREIRPKDLVLLVSTWLVSIAAAVLLAS